MSKILDELEFLGKETTAAYEQGDLHDGSRWEGLYWSAVQKALPALIRVASAAQALNAKRYAEDRDYYLVTFESMDDLAEALQALRELEVEE